MIEQVFGPYRIVSKLGAGGMGEVYRAGDTNLERDVAIKVLPELWAGDPERLARFRREAQVQLFRIDGYEANSNSRPYDISSDGKRFVFPKLVNESRPTLYVVTNWLQEVAAKVGAQ